MVIIAKAELGLLAHLLRRAGFGSPYDELEAYGTKGYDATLEELLHPEEQPELERDVMRRYRTLWHSWGSIEDKQDEWVYRMINTRRPLEEKIALFWHGIFCTGHAKCDNPGQQRLEFDMFRVQGLDNFRDLLGGLAKDPAMLYYLDNCLSHKNAINENWSRELLELFSVGVGMDRRPNYTEEDVKVCARAFTGWTVTNAIPRYPWDRHEACFIFHPSDHDDGEKSFLGETGRFNGEDVIDIICRQPGTARFVSRHLYNFFVADETPVPSWQNTPPRDPVAINMLEDEYFRSNYDIRSMLRLLFRSHFFKNSRFLKVKSPTETVVGTMRLAGDFSFPKPGLNAIALSIRYMGQNLLNPPTVEGWHTGKEWIDSGTLLERINFTAEQIANVNLPGVRAMIDRLHSECTSISPARLVDRCLDFLGSYRLQEENRSRLVSLFQDRTELITDTDEFDEAVAQVLRLIASTPEYLFE